MPILQERRLGDAAPFYPSLWIADLKALLTPGNTILPSDLQAVKDEAAQEIRKAGGTDADVQSAYSMIDRTVAGVVPGLISAGNPLGTAGTLEGFLQQLFGKQDPSNPTGPNLWLWLGIGGAGLLALAILKR